MRLAVRKSDGFGGSQYALHIEKMSDRFMCEAYERMGYVIVDIEENQGRRLLMQMMEAIRLQCELASITEKTLREKVV